MGTLHTLIDDPVTPLLRDLEHATLGLQRVNRVRLAGDVARIASAAVALTALANEIARMNKQREEDEGNRKYAEAMNALHEAISTAEPFPGKSHFGG